MTEQIEKVNADILDAQTKVEQYKNAIIQLYVETFDTWNARYSNMIGIRQKSIDSLQKQIALVEASGYLAGRSLYDQQIDQTKKQIGDLQEERERLTRDLNNAIANGVKVGTDEWYKMVDAIHAVDSAVQDAEISIKNTEKAIKKLYVEYFNREKQQYSNMTDARQTGISVMEKQIELLRADNYMPTSDIYETEIGEYQRTLKTLKQERTKLTKDLNKAIKNGVEEGSDEWYEMASAIRDVDLEIQDTELSIKNAKKAITDLAVESFNRDATRYQNIIDSRQKAVDAMQQQIALIEATGNVAGRELYDAQIVQYEKQLVDYEQERETLVKDLNEALAAGVKEGTEEWYNMINAINSVDSNVQKVKTSIEQTKKAIESAYTTLFTNEAQRYSNQNTALEYGLGAIEKEMAKLKAAGELIGKSFYQDSIDQTYEQIDTLTAERASLMERLDDALENGVEVGSENFMKMVSELYKVDTAIQDCEKSVEEFENALLELDTATFERIQTRFNNLNSELSNIIDMYDDAEVATTDNQWTKEGLTQIGLYAQQYELAKKQVASYNDEITQLNINYQRGEYSATEYAERLAKLKNEQWNAVKASEAAKKAIMELNKTRVEQAVKGIEEETEAYEKLIKAQKESLQAEKDLHEYEKSIEESSKNITSLERQLAALEGDDSLSASARRAQLEQELAEAREDRAELEYQHSIEMQQDALDQQQEAFSEAQDARIEALRATLEEEVTILTESFDAVKMNADIISEQLLLLAQNLNLTMSPEITAPWEAGSLALDGYKTLFETSTSAFTTGLDEVILKEQGLQDKANDANKAVTDLFKLTSKFLADEIEKANEKFRDQEKAALAGSDAIADNFTKNAKDLVDWINQSTVAFNKQEAAAQGATNAIVRNFAQDSEKLVKQLGAAKTALEEEEKAANKAAKKIGAGFNKKSGKLVDQIKDAYGEFETLEENSRKASEQIADAFRHRANELADSIKEAWGKADNLGKAAEYAGGALDMALNSDYSGSSAVGALDSIKDAADGVKTAADNATKALEGMLETMSQAGSTSTESHTVYGGPNASKYGTLVRDANGNIVQIGYKAKGSKSISHDQLAWTQEDGPEAIVDPATGGILTPLKKGSMVLPADQTANIWEWSNFNPEEFASRLAQNINTAGNAPVQTNTMQVGSLIQVNGDVNDVMSMMEIAAQQASNKIKQSFKQLSNGLNG